MDFPKQFLLWLFVLLVAVSPVYAEVSAADEAEINNELTVLVDALNAGEVESVLSLVSSSAREGLRAEIRDALTGQSMQYRHSVSSYEEVGDGQVRVNTRFSASGIGWEINGMSNYFVFERSEDSWLLVDTNFHERVGSGYIWKVMGWIFLVLGIVGLLCLAFWVWMLIDCSRRSFDDKMLWLLIIFFLSFLGAVAYFFVKRKKLKKQASQPAQDSPQEASSQQTQQIVDYLSKNRDQYSAQQLRDALLNQGYSQEVVDEAIRIAGL